MSRKLAAVVPLSSYSVLESYNSVTADVLAFIVHAGDESNLILDPDLDSYYAKTADHRLRASLKGPIALVGGTMASLSAELHPCRPRGPDSTGAAKIGEDAVGDTATLQAHLAPALDRLLAARVGRLRASARRTYVVVGAGIALAVFHLRVAQIAAAVDQVADGSARVRSDIVTVSQVAERCSASTEQVSASTQQTTAATLEIAASAGDPARTAHELEALVGTFHLS
jgi:hypothetical protein